METKTKWTTKDQAAALREGWAIFNEETMTAREHREGEPSWWDRLICRWFGHLFYRHLDQEFFWLKPCCQRCGQDGRFELDRWDGIVRYRSERNFARCLICEMPGVHVHEIDERGKPR